MIRLAGYSVLEKFHDGTNTQLYRGTRDADQAAVVIKVPRSEYPSTREIARLQHEYRLLSEHRIPGVARAYALEKLGRGLALVMERLPGQPLQTVMRSRQLTIDECLSIGIQLCRILEALHEKQLVHKDIKPQNVLLDPKTGAVHLVDLGIATHVAPEGQGGAEAEAEVLEGTLAYISPEQTGRISRAIDARSDLYSLGVTLYELLSGVLPFQSAEPLELLHGHIARAPQPPSVLRPEIPEILSAIVLKLLMKMAEDRYQTAAGLRLDLEQCQREWQANREIADFPLAQHDHAGDLRLPQRLFGRQKERAQLLAALERARSGALELVLLSGPSGIGKSALATELYQPAVQHGDYLLRLRFEEPLRGIPYEPVLRALRGLLRQLLAEPAALLQQWEQRFLAALEGNGQVLTALLPELELILGPQPRAAELPPREAQNRFELLFQRFLRVFASSEHALVLLADDLQYADSASLNLLKQLLTDPYGHYLLVVGSYRPSEVEASHPLALGLDALRQERGAPLLIELGHLGKDDVCQLLSEALSLPVAEVEPLAAAVLVKTHGNPFFVHQFIKALSRQHGLVYSPADGRWRWDLAQVSELAATDNVSELMIDLLRELPEATREVLQTAACIGNQFDLGMLLQISSQPAEVCLSAVSSAVRAGLLAPLNSDYRFLETLRSVPQRGAEHVPASELAVTLKFLHERLQQAAAAQLPEPRQQELHLRIGRLRLDAATASGEVALFEAVSHLNRGVERLRAQGDVAALLELARLNLTAGQRAKKTAAFEAAGAFFAAGTRALQGFRWSEHEDLLFPLHLEQAHCAQLCGHMAEAEEVLRDLLERTQSGRRHALVYLRWCELRTALADFQAAIRLGLRGLAAVSEPLAPLDSDVAAALEAETSALSAGLSGRPLSALLDIPLNQSEEASIAMQLLLALLVPTYGTRSPLYPIVVMRQINISLRHGLCEETAAACATNSFLLTTVFGKPREGAEYAQVALALSERVPSPSMALRVVVGISASAHLHQPLREVVQSMKQARRHGLSSGDFAFLSLLESNLAYFGLQITEDFNLLLQEIEHSLVVLQRTRDHMSTVQVTLARQWVRALVGKTKEPTSLTDERFNEVAEQPRLATGGIDFLYLYFLSFRMQLAYLYGKQEEAFELARACEAVLDSAPGLAQTCEFIFWLALCLLARLPELRAGEPRAEVEARIEKYHQQLRAWAGFVEANYLHRERLVAAERARLAGRTAEAILLYDEAIAAAHRGGFPLHEALAHELAGRFYASIGRSKLGSYFLTEVFYAYMRLGLLPKATHLLNQHPELLRAETRVIQDLARQERPSRATTSSASSHPSSDHQFDVNAVLRASEVISRELAIDKVIEQVLSVVMSSAGGQRGFLLLDRGGTLQLEAARSVAPDSTRIGLGIPIERAGGRPSAVENELPLSVIHYVVRSREVVALHAIAADSRFANDPYVLKKKPKAVLCLPLLHQGRLTGVLYLENNAAALTFSPARIDLLRILSAQAATALENAQLLHRVQEATEKVRRTNEVLEQQVAQRTEELQRNNADLEAANQRLQVELAERARAERERALLQEQVLQQQRERLSELSTPIIPITDRIMVMPLIGTMDSERANQLLEAALSGAQHRGAAVVILDITGLRHMDTAIAGSLIKTARALRLLGAQAILTGIRAEVAQTLVSLGIDLTSIESRSTLQSGIAAALKRAGSGAGIS